MYDITTRVAIEVVSAVACAILVRFMIKPYIFTREARYIGLPLGFSFLGSSYLLSAIIYMQPNFMDTNLKWIQLLVRSFSFAFIAMTYYFSKKPSKNTRLAWDLTLSTLILTSLIGVLIIVVLPQYIFQSNIAASIPFRAFNLACLIYITFSCVKAHIETPDTTTIWAPFGYVLLAIGQYSIIIWAIQENEFAFWGALTLRLIGLSVFLLITYQTNQTKKKGPIK